MKKTRIIKLKSNENEEIIMTITMIKVIITTITTIKIKVGIKFDNHIKATK